MNGKKNNSKRNFIFIAVFIFVSVKFHAQNTFPFQNSALPFDTRIDDLLSRLTAAEKTSLLLYNSPAIERFGIPAYNWWNEALHGVARAGKATVFPQAIGLAATFDEDLLFRAATAISDEARAKHNAASGKGNGTQYAGLTFWSPNINIFRDPRWGRGQETYGEDPYLTSQMGTAFVKGMQGNDSFYLKTAACAKHFAVHSGPEISRHRFNALPDETDLRETYLPAFKALVEAGVETVMCAYNRLNNEPCCANQYLLNDLLRKEWGFDGHIVTDCWALDDIWALHKTKKTKLEAAVSAAKAGVNLNCGYLYAFLPEAVEKNLISEKELNEILKPLLRTRMKLGLLGADDENPFSNIEPTVVNSEAHKNLALEAAQKSIVLLKNKNRTLPLDKKKLRKLFVTGPTAADATVLLGNYNGLSGELVTILEGIIDRADEGTIVDYAKGTLLSGGKKSNGFWQASSADAVVACVGLSRLLEGENGDALLNENGGDRTDLRLPKNQIEFVKKLREETKNKPLILVITGGSAIATPEIAALADAILFAWYPGEQGGNAIADAIFGNYNPAGRLPVTFYSSVKDLPDFDDYDMRGRTYRFFQGEPQFEFGYGLSYSKFEYSNLKEKRKDNSLVVSFSVENISKIGGDEVVQLYVKQIEGNSKTPLKNLRRFKRVFIKAGERKEISFVLEKEDFASWNTEQKAFFVRPGKYEIQIGASSEDIRLNAEIDME